MKNAQSILINIEDLSLSASNELKSCTNLNDLEDWRIKFLGRNGELSELMKVMKDISQEDKRIIGPKLNQLKNSLGDLFENAKKINNQTQNHQEGFDITLPGRNLAYGSLHPTTLIIREICESFNSMGFQIYEGNEIETEKYNFDTGMNIYEKLTVHESSDRYEYVLPYYNFSRNFYFDRIPGAFNYTSDGENNLNNTNRLNSRVVNMIFFGAR